MSCEETKAQRCPRTCSCHTANSLQCWDSGLGDLVSFIRACAKGSSEKAVREELACLEEVSCKIRLRREHLKTGIKGESKPHGHVGKEQKRF